MADEAYAEFFLNSRMDVAAVECLDISHPSFSQTYHVVRNVVAGVTAGGIAYDYYPLQIEALSSRANLDFGIKVTLGDLGQVLPLELDRVWGGNTLGVKPTVVYSVYRSDDYSSPLFPPITLEIATLIFNRDGAQFEAHATPLNNVRTGECYTLARFPMLAGYV